MSDLKTYDVPDPPRPGGWFLRCLAGAFVGLLVAAGFIRATRVSHLAWVADNSPDYIAGHALRYLKRNYDPETLRPVALGIADPAVRGSFHAALVGTKDPAQLEAMAAYLRTLSYDREERDAVVDSMVALDADQAATRLIACYAAPEGSVASWEEELAATIEARVPAEKLAAEAVKIEAPARRGRFHRALALTKDPGQIEAVFAWAATVVPTDPGAERPAAWAGLVESLGAFGAAATPALEKTLEQTESRSLVSLAAEALVASDLPFLVKRARRLLDEYDEAVPQLARDEMLLNAVEEGQRPEGVSDEQVTQARARYTAADARAFMIFEMLRALERVRGDQTVDFCIVRGLSCFNQRIASWSVMRIKERFEPDQLVDTLFSYMAQKSQFMVSEVDVYEDLMKELGGAGAARVADNLERLIGEAQGDPEGVFWLYKKMGFTILRELGGPEAVPTLEKFAADGGSYTLTETRTDGAGRRTRQETQKRYADEVRSAIAAIQARAAGEGEEEGD